MSAILVWLGVAFEAAGFYISWHALNIEGEAVQRFTKRPQVITVQRAFESETAFGMGALLGEPPSIDQRLDLLENQINVFKDEVNARFANQAREFREEINLEARGISDHLSGELLALARLVEGVHRDSMTRRLGFSLFVFGTILNAASQFV